MKLSGQTIDEVNRADATPLPGEDGRDEDRAPLKDPRRVRRRAGERGGVARRVVDDRHVGSLRGRGRERGGKTVHLPSCTAVSAMRTPAMSSVT